MQIFNANPVSPLRAWVHAILPLVYDDSLSYYELLAKVADKMNEVVTHLNDVQEALHDNDEFLKNSIENLTQSFNNFQQSMLTRQENFETTWNERCENFEQSLTEKENQFESKITEQQTAFESKINSDFSTLSAQLDGDIANWEGDVQEDLETWQRTQEQKEQTFESNMEQKFTKFLEDYQKKFGVVQTTGDSTTDVMSQSAVTDFALTNLAVLLNTQSISEYPGTENINTITQGIYHYDSDVIKTVTGMPDLGDYGEYVPGTLIVFDGVARKTTFSNFKVQMLYLLPNGTNVDVFYRFGAGGPNWSTWDKFMTYRNVVQTTGDSTTDVMSQAAVSEYALTNLPVPFNADNISQYPGADNINTITPGIYHYDDDVIRTVTGMPDLSGYTLHRLFCTLIVFHGSLGKTSATNLKVQTLYLFQESTNYVDVFYRFGAGGESWTTWHKLNIESALPSAYYYNMQYANLNGHTCVDKIALRQCKSHKIIVRGDSYADIDKSWGNNIGSALEASSTEIIGIGGETLISMLSDLQISSYDDVKALFIEGGLNDCHQKIDFNAFKEAIENFCTTFKEEHPDIHVVFISPPKSWYADESYERDNLAIYSAIMCNVAVKNGYSIVNGFDCPAGYCKSELIDTLMPDNIHFGAGHYDIFAKTIISAII